MTTFTKKTTSSDLETKLNDIKKVYHTIVLRKVTMALMMLTNQNLPFNQDQKWNKKILK